MQKIEEPSCGHGVSIMTGREVFVGNQTAHYFNGKSWGALQEESVYVPAVESMAPLETYIINSCKKMGCNDNVDQFKVKLNSLNGIQGAIVNP